MSRIPILTALLALVGLFATPAAAQEVPAPALAPVKEPSVFDGDYLIVGFGTALVSSYEGSDSTSVIPAVGIMGSLGGIDINPRAGGIALDLWSQPPGSRIDFGIGPVARYRANRSGNVRDPVVALLGRRSAIIEAGIATNLAFKRLFNSSDQVSVGTDIRWDITGHGAGMIVTPGFSYFTPLSRAQIAGIQLSATFASNRFADYHFAISPAESAASGLPVYDAKGGFKDWSIGAFTARDLNGNFLDGGFAIGVGAMYSRLTGSAAESPITALRGKRDQWVFGGGLAYVFGTVKAKCKAFP